MSALES